MLKLFAGLVLACFVTPAFAQCVSMDKDIAKWKAEGDTVAADVKVQGANIDRLVIDVDKDVIWIIASKDDCILGAALPFDAVASPTTSTHGKDSGTPAPLPPRGGGQEIGI